MSFSPITVDTSWQDLAIAKEIAVALNKRIAAVGAPCTLEELLHITSFDTDRVSVYDFVQTCQAEIESLCTRFCNAGLDKVADGVLISTFPNTETFMSVAGLPWHNGNHGWHRMPNGQTPVDEWPDYSNWTTKGKIQPKDLAGPWLFKDLEIALSALTRVVTHTSWDIDHMRKIAIGDSTGPYGDPTLIPSVPAFENSTAEPMLAIWRSKNTAGTPIDQTVWYCYSPAEIITGMTADPKTITTVYRIDNANMATLFSTFDFYNFGNPNWIEGHYVIDQVFTGVTATSKSVPVMGPITDWGFADQLPWSSIPAQNSGTGESGMRQAGLVISCMWWVIDYSFEA